MRLDIRNKEDYALCWRATTYLNDVKVAYCVMADEEAGVIERWEINDQGHVVVFQDEDGERAARLIREQGIVRIEIAE